jgi:2-amino-4-hydroxy-6-hydroxymethyldihydropteridine diphosphokinase/dihydropteroate synthase
MAIVIGLGSNLNQPLQQLRRACKQLIIAGVSIKAYSNIYQTQPLLPENAPSNWADKAYLNAAVMIETRLSPNELLQVLKKIEREMGRQSAERWAPRVIDLDVLLFNDVVMQEPHLQLPHPGLHQRIFAMKPLLDVLPTYPHENLAEDSIISLPHLLQGPEIMGILNVTPDSFSDGGRYVSADAALQQAQQLFSEGADIIDIGAESTRPNAVLIDADTEWQRLAPILKGLEQLWRKDMRPLISLDTRHAATVKKALAFGIDWVNDVSQQEFAKMVPILKEGQLKYVAMHHLGVPPQVGKKLQEDPIKALLAYQALWQQNFAKADLDSAQLILDAGLGFGKTPEQQWAIIHQMQELKISNTPWLIGHSRKSFLKSVLPALTTQGAETATAMISARLAHQGTEYLRVHAPAASIAAIRLQKFL